MAEEFSDVIVELAWARSGEKCECTSTWHLHAGRTTLRCNAPLWKWRRVDRGDRQAGRDKFLEFSWEPESISGLYENSVSDCVILCKDCRGLGLRRGF